MGREADLSSANHANCGQTVVIILAAKQGRSVAVRIKSIHHWYVN